MKLVFFLLFLLFWLFFACRKEGFDLGIPSMASVGKYDYLKPPPGPAVLSEEVENKFIEAYNKNAVTLLPAAVLDKPKMDGLKPLITVAEVDYYVKNNKWPYGASITYCLEQKKALLEKMPVKTVEDVQKIWPTRLAFTIFCNMECSNSPASLECDIFSGKHIPSKEENT